MAKPCPQCSRSNGDDAVKCLYCAAPLSASVPNASAGVDESGSLSPVPEEQDDWHLVILIPSGPPDERMIAALADAAGLSAYDARLSLTSTRPRLFRRIDGALAARALSETLGAARVPHYVVSEKSIRALPVARAQGAELKERHMNANLDGQRLSIPYSEILLLVRGEITRESHNENKIATRKGANRSLSPGLLLHLYSREASVAVEVDPEGFSWPRGDSATRSALLNLERFLDELEGRSPGLLVDRGFDLEPPVLSRAGGDVTDFAQVFAAGGVPGGVLYHNEEQFRFYARWRYRLERHLEKTRANT